MEEKLNPDHLSAASKRRYELDTVSSRSLIILGLSLLAIVLLIAGGTALTFNSLTPQKPHVTSDKQWDLQKTNPGVEPNQAYDREKLQTDEDVILHRYSWQDKQRGMAQIPIDRAIELMTAQNLNPEWPSSTSEPH